MSNWPTTAGQQLLADLLGELPNVLPQAQQLRQQLHRNPRLAGDESDTASQLKQALGLSGISGAIDVADTGFLYRIGPKTGQSIGVRAEMDALPIQEQTKVSWASQVPNVMHACGHDVHMAATWALFQVAKKVELPVGLVGIFQPREETQPSGARDIVTYGVLAEQDVAAVIGAHLQPQVSFGVISTGVGGVNAAADEFEITINGAHGHGAYPQVSTDPIPALAAILAGLPQLVGRNIDPTHPAVISVGQVNSGAAVNVIPDQAMVRGIIRATTNADQQLLHQKVIQLAENSAKAHGCSADVQIITGDPVLWNDADLVAAVDPLFADTELALAAEPFRSCGADDFSYYSQLAPSLMMFLGTRKPEHDPAVGLHHARFLPEEELLHHNAIALITGYVGAAHLLGAI